MIYEELIDQRETIKRAKVVLKDYKKILAYLDSEIYYSQLRTSWNIGEPLGGSPPTTLDRLIKYNEKNALKLRIVNKVQRAIDKLQTEEITILYLTYIKGYSPTAIQNEMAISERKRRRLSRQAHLSFARSYGIEVILNKQK